MGWVVNAKHRPFYPRERPGTDCTGRWMGFRDGLYRCGKSRPNRDSIPEPSSPQQVAIPTTLSQPTLYRTVHYINIKTLVAMQHLIIGHMVTQHFSLTMTCNILKVAHLMRNTFTPSLLPGVSLSRTFPASLGVS